MADVDWAAELLGPAAGVKPVADQPQQATDWGAELLGKPAASAPEVRRAPTSADLTYDPDRTMGFVGQAIGSLAATDDQWKFHAAKTLYPNEDPETAMRRFGRTKDGRTFHRGDDGKLYEVQPPKGIARLANVGEGVGASIPAVAAGVAGLTALPYTGGLGSIPAAGIGGYAGETARQALGNAIIGGPTGYNVGSAVKEGVLGGAGQGIGVGLNRFAGRYAAPDLVDYNPQATQHLYDQSQRVGVRLTPAEATGMQSLVGEQTRLQGSPQAANTMRRFTAERNTEAGQAWQGFLDSVGRPRDAGRLGVAARDVATDIVTDAQAARTAAVQPFYEAAERQIASVNPGDVVRFVQDALPTAKGSERNALRFVMSQLQREGGDQAFDMSFRGLNGAKMAIDAVIQNEDLAMKQGIDRTAHATLQRARNLIVQAIEASPGARGAGGTPGPYAAGRALYEQQTRQLVDPIQEVLAPLLRANPANSSIVRAAQAVLDPATRTPSLVARARHLIERRDPEVWGSMVRQFLHDHAYQALQENAKGTVTNVPGNIAKRVGHDKMEAILRRAITPDQFRHYQDIMDVFRAAGRATDMNSDTAFKQEALRQAKNRARPWFMKLMTKINPAEALRSFDEFVTDRNFQRQASRIADIFASGDRDAINALRQLRQLRPDDVRRRIVIGHLLANTAEYGVDHVLE